MREIKIGDRVRGINKTSITYGETGTVVDITTDPHPHLVEYDHHIGGHDGSATGYIGGRDGYCWYHSEEDLELLKEHKTPQIEKICKILNVELGEEWMATNGNIYVLERDGSMKRVVQEDYLPRRGYPTHRYEEVETKEYMGLLTGSIRPRWKPKLGELYYVANITEKDLFLECDWLNEELDEVLYKRGLIFKTKEEAIKYADKLMEFVKSKI